MKSGSHDDAVFVVGLSLARRKNHFVEPVFTAGARHVEDPDGFAGGVPE
jgi:hypothetical protein